MITIKDGVAYTYDELCGDTQCECGAILDLVNIGPEPEDCPNPECDRTYAGVAGDIVECDLELEMV